MLDEFLPIIALFGALLLTVAVEGVIMALATKSVTKVKASLLCNLLTNPLLNALLMLGTYIFCWTTESIGYYIALFVLEVAVVIVEGKVYSCLNAFQSDKKAYIASFALNLSSFLVGAILSLIVAIT